MENLEEVQVKQFVEGDVVTCVIDKVEEKVVYVNVEGSKLNGMIPIGELSAMHIEKTSDAVSVGDTITARVKKVEEETLILSKKYIDVENNWKILENKFANNETLDVVVTEAVEKKGLVVDAGIRGFIPASQVDLHFVEDLSTYVGTTLTVKVKEIDREKNRVILSHRLVAEQQHSAKKAEIIERIQAGSIIEGTVQRITDFGVFVDIGGIDGLVHISQLSFEHVKHPSEVVKEGQTVQVKVLSVDTAQEKISLSIKETLSGPWHHISDKVKKGDTVEGVVRRMTGFGVFVEIFPGVEGLVHISQISHKHIKTPSEVLAIGDTVQSKVLEVNETDKRISLSIRELLEGPVADSVDVSQYTKQNEASSYSMGELFGDLLKKFK